MYFTTDDIYYIELKLRINIKPYFLTNTNIWRFSAMYFKADAIFFYKLG